MEVLDTVTELDEDVLDDMVSSRLDPSQPFAQADPIPEPMRQATTSGVTLKNTNQKSNSQIHAASHCGGTNIQNHLRNGADNRSAILMQSSSEVLAFEAKRRGDWSFLNAKPADSAPLTAADLSPSGRGRALPMDTLMMHSAQSRLARLAWLERWERKLQDRGYSIIAPAPRRSYMAQNPRRWSVSSMLVNVSDDSENRQRSGSAELKRMGTDAQRADEGKAVEQQNLSSVEVRRMEVNMQGQSERDAPEWEPISEADLAQEQLDMQANLVGAEAEGWGSDSDSDSDSDKEEDEGMDEGTDEEKDESGPTEDFSWELNREHSEPCPIPGFHWQEDDDKPSVGNDSPT